jgi:sugar phosphate isomerase/epimerase
VDLLESDRPAFISIAETLGLEAAILPHLAEDKRPKDAAGWKAFAAKGVYYEPDIGWIARSGSDIRAELEKFPGKIVAFHVKDTAPAGVTRDDGWTDVGAGTIDWKGVWPTIGHSGCNLLVTENDDPSDWRGFAAHSYSFLSGLTGNKKA